MPEFKFDASDVKKKDSLGYFSSSFSLPPIIVGGATN